MKQLMLVLATVISLVLFPYNLSSGEPLSETVARLDIWWENTENEDPYYYQEIDIGGAILHLCGSREWLIIEFNKRYPYHPINPNSGTYMFTTSGTPIHVWLVVKIVDKKIIFHKWALGHEMIRVLSLLNANLVNADDYF